MLLVDCVCCKKAVFYKIVTYMFMVFFFYQGYIIYIWLWLWAYLLKVIPETRRAH
jgi:hypothetical protein